MKKIFLAGSFSLFTLFCVAQQATFDLVTCTPPKGWKKQQTETMLQLTKEDAVKGTYCSITIVKSIPVNSTSKENFDVAWGTLVKEMVTVSAAPEMQTPSSENGWEAQSGYAPFENDGNKGVVLLVTSTGYEKMVNLIALTNTDAYEKELTAFLGSINLAKPSGNTNKNNLGKTGTVASPPKSQALNTGFSFNTTNFDDGWTSTVQADWVEVIKGNSKILIHYPRDETVFPSDPDPLIRTVWDILVANRYSNLRNFKTSYISTYNRPYLGMGYMTNNQTGKEVFVVLYRQGETGWIEFIEANKNSFIQQYKFDPEAIRWDSETELLKPLETMVNYNKFAIAVSDFKGTWTSDFTGIQHLYNIYTGNSAGMNIHQSSQTFQFGAGNTYNWSLVAVNGTTGNTKYVSVKSSGKFSVPNNWQVRFSDMEGKPKLYDAFFVCIKGARLLKMNDAVARGSGMYTVYGKK
ncbi:MAG TPA: hypothetical protein VGO58_08320 [Chitinophagaceae bacterium]|nr:hypothetical protein [Chitinophagaceae bacterium]